ncbi:MAG: restriction endonuclease [Alcanivorax sp.]|nr:restriction endonuclease [Alcanivorax sp.]
MNNQMIPIGKLFDIEKGDLQSTKCTPGEYDFITAAEEWKTHHEYSHECEALIFAAAASGSLGRTHYVDGKFTTSDLCYILTPKNEEKYPLNLSFYHFVFNSLRPALVAATKSGTSKESINQTNFKNYEIPYFDMELQDLWIEKLKNTLGMKDLLAGELTHQQTLLKKLRQQILQEAIEGKLTADWRAQNPEVEPASELLKRIAAEKTQLVKDKKIKAQKPLSLITQEEKPFELPQGWEWCRLGDVAYGFQYGTSSKSKQSGDVPVLRMGNIQFGEIDWNGLVYSSDAVEIEKYRLIVGDLLFNRTNSRELVGKTALYRGCQQAIYAGYLVRFHMAGSILPDYANIVMNSRLHSEWCAEVRTDALGQSNINATKLSGFRFPLAPIDEQEKIIDKADKLLSLCDQLETQITQNQSHAEELMQAVLKEAFSHHSEAGAAATTPQAQAAGGVGA